MSIIGADDGWQSLLFAGLPVCHFKLPLVSEGPDIDQCSSPPEEGLLPVHRSLSRVDIDQTQNPFDDA